MTPEKKEILAKLLAEVRELHEKFYSSAPPDYELMAMYFLSKEGGNCVIIGLAAMNRENADALVQMVRSKADQDGCDRYVYTSEGWSIPPEALPTHRPGETFASRPDRMEVLSVEAGLRSGESAVQRAFIIRSATESPKLQWEEPLYGGDDGVLRSRFNIWNSQPTKVQDCFQSTARH